MYNFRMCSVVHFQSFGTIEAYARLLQDFSLVPDSTECTIFFLQISAVH